MSISGAGNPMQSETKLQLEALAPASWRASLEIFQVVPAGSVNQKARKKAEHRS
jgi:hypothetical protein